ncbi:MAG: glycosyltransferase family 2 protein [Rhodobacteraceae bacterium]|nr:MAG: glycosyltransferase family 2 protein [Paracoccaceae bacterium]
MTGQGGSVFPLRLRDFSPMRDGDHVAFDHWEDLFNLSLWSAATHLANPRLVLRGTGRVQLKLWRQGDEGDPSPVLDAEHDLPLILPLPEGTENGIFWPEITARGPVSLDSLGWSADPPTRDIRIALVITTYRREAEVRTAVAKLLPSLQRDLPPGAAHLVVVDNGRSLTLPAAPELTRLDNPNLGGSGGFARGLAFAQDGGFTHALFMDDDAATTPEALIRTHAFLSRARDDRAAVLGAMLTDTEPPRVFEYGAEFDGLCRPLCHGLDPTSRTDALHMERDTHAPLPDTHYGGWWFFAFPLAPLRHWPFPFFVRGDDSGFSLSNPFTLWRIAGVASVQEGFDLKSSPLTRYLDFRYHLIHGLVFDSLRLSRFKGLSVALRLIVRNILTLHYDSAEAELLAWAEVLSGPETFATDPTAQKGRAAVAELLSTERWSPTPMQPVSTLSLSDPHWRRKWIKLTLNGHLVPFWATWMPDRVIDRSTRGDMRSYFFARQVVVQDEARGTAMVLRHDKRRAFRIGLRAAGLSLRWLLGHSKLRKSFKTGYDEMTTRAFWDAQFIREDL